MKLLFLTVMPSPYQRQLFAAMDAASDLDIAVRYYTIGAHDREWAAPNFHPFEQALPGRVLRPLGPSAHWNGSVISEIKAVDADLVIVSDYSAPTAQRSMRWLSRTGRPFVFWGEVPGFSNRGAIGSMIRRQLQAPLSRASAIAAIGSKAEQAYRDLFPHLPVFNIPYFCDLSAFQTARQNRADRDDDLVNVLFSGQMIHRKGVDLLLQAFIAASNDAPNLRLKLLGNGPEKDRLIATIPSELQDCIEFLGHKDPAELPALFANADLFCLPSRHDGWGVVINEALGAGLPIIATDTVGAALDLVENGENGFIVPIDDPDALTAALRNLADQDTRSRMTAAAQRMARQWTLEEGVSRWRAAAKATLEHTTHA